MYICIYCHGLLLPLRPVSSRLVSSRFSPFFSTLVPWPADAFSKSVSMRIRPNPIRRRISYIVQSSIVAIPPVSVFKRIQQSGKKEKTLLSCSRSTRFLTPLTSRAIRSGNPQTRSTIFQYLFSLRSFFLLFPHPPLIRPTISLFPPMEVIERLDILHERQNHRSKREGRSRNCAWQLLIRDLLRFLLSQTRFVSYQNGANKD